MRALARDPQKAAGWSQQGIEVRRGDLAEPDSLAAALEGVAGAFLMIPPVLVPEPGFPEATAVIASFQAALRASPPLRLALLSSVGSERAYGLGNIATTHLMEEALGDLPFPTAFVRAGGFLENYVGALGAAGATGVFHSLLQPTDRAFPMVAAADVGAEIARLLVEGWSGKRTVDLGSGVSPDDLARAMGEALGRPVVARAVPRERWAATLESIGLPSGRTALYEEMMDSFNSRWIDFGTPGAASVPGAATPAQVFARARDAGGAA